MENTPEEAKLWRGMEKFMDRFTRHAGEWHTVLCHFVHWDEGVCNCNLPENRRLVKDFLLSTHRAAREEGRREGALEVIKEITEDVETKMKQNRTRTDEFGLGYDKALEEVFELIHPIEIKL